jgi:hypothetical protein
MSRALSASQLLDTTLEPTRSSAELEIKPGQGASRRTEKVVQGFSPPEAAKFLAGAPHVLAR